MAHVGETVRMSTLTARGVLGGGSDGALIARVRAGDDAAFETIYDRYHGNLLAFCRHMLGSREEAEDALQHVFLAAYRGLRHGAGATRLKPWLYTLARNRCLSLVRGWRDEVALDDDATAGRDGLVAEVDRRADLRALVRDLQRLPTEQRAALVLFELGDQSHEEIAAVLGVRREKVKALVFQAREALMGWRAARAAPCGPVREQLATLTGSALRRGSIRRHVEQCPGCAEYEAEVRRQRAALAVVLPVAPAAGLKAAVLGSALGGAGVAASGAATGAVGGLAALGAKGLATKVLVIAAIAGAGATGYVAVEGRHRRVAPAQHAPRAAPIARALVVPKVPAAPMTRTIAATQAAPTWRPVKRAAKDGRRHARRNGRALGTTATKGRAAAPGRLKALRSPARGKALGAVKAKSRPSARARAKTAPGRPNPKPAKPAAAKSKPAKPAVAKPKPAKPAVAKPKPAKAGGAKPSAARPNEAKRSLATPANAASPPGPSAAGPPGQARKQAAATP
jgi:RNA polymerase sigma factor (sigma-70 family)